MTCVSEPVKPRPYRSPLRLEQAEATRRAVLDAARALFSTSGYPDTTVVDVARRAAVSVDTVYASVGRKPQLLLAVHDEVLGGVDAEQRDYVRQVRAAPDAAAKIAAYAEALGRLLPQTVPLAEALSVAGQADDRCRAVAEQLDERRAGNMRLFAADLRATGELRDDLTDDEVADLVWTMNSPQFFRLVTSRGRDYAATVADVWTRTLLAPPR
jgi:AcrR family transcriptional regulator